MKCFIITDVHSFYTEMIEALNKKGFDKDNPNHVLISLGDLLDRGPDAIKCLEFINSLPRKILIKGNHEDLMQEAIKRRSFAFHDYHNCTVQTVEQITGIKQQGIGVDSNSHTMLDSINNNELWNTYINSCIDFADTDKYIFVHGWTPNPNNPHRDWRVGNWNDARWYNGMEYWNLGYRHVGKTVFCGHYHTSWGHCYLHNKGSEWDDEAEFCSEVTNTELPKAHFETFKDKGIIALDACTMISGFCNCETVNISREQLKKYLDN